MSSFSFNKHPNYYPNGSGRDMYIYTNNGGYFEKALSYSPSVKYYSISPKTLINLPSLPLKTIHYNSDGTGRDTYIKTDDGGNIPNSPGLFSSKSVHFISNLREYKAETKPPSSKNFFRKGQFLVPIKESIKIAHRAKIQKKLIERLTKPKSLPKITK